MLDWLFSGTAHAMGGAPGGTGNAGPAGIFIQLVPFLAVFLIFYFVLFRPQQAAARKRQDMLKAIKKGDSVYTTGGVLGKITGITEKVVTLEVADNVRVKVYRTFVAGVVSPGEDARPEGSA
jgi:preprotein translocase subunit YajC